MSEEMDFDFGASQGAQVAKESNKGGSFAREVEYLSLDASEAGVAQGKNTVLVRFLTDAVRRDQNAPASKYSLAWITVGQHYAATKPKPDYVAEDRVWPGKMGAGCRKDKVFTAKFNGDCFLCSRGEKPSNRTWSLAVEREEVRDEQNQILGYRDKTREVFDTDANGDLIVLKEEGGKKEYQMKTVPAFILINQGWKNFFGPLDSSQSYYKSLLDGDWVISRSGMENNNTVYNFIRVAEQTLPEGNPYGLPAGTKYDLAIPGLMEKVYPDMPDLRRIIADRVSDDYFGRFFIPGWAPPEHETKKAQAQTSTTYMAVSTPSPQPVATPDSPKTEEPASSALDALKNRVTQNAGSPAQQ